jgi:hypothetical protein
VANGANTASITSQHSISLDGTIAKDKRYREVLVTAPGWSSLRWLITGPALAARTFAADHLDHSDLAANPSLIDSVRFKVRSALLKANAPLPTIRE